MPEQNVHILLTYKIFKKYLCTARAS